MEATGRMPDWRDRLRDAWGFLEVAEAVDDADHGNQAASNAILAIIAANDAVCMCLGQRKPSGASHGEAAQTLQDVCRGTKWEAEASLKARQLLEVIRQKNAAQYNGVPLAPDVVARIIRQTQRFITWAEDVLAAYAPAHDKRSLR